MKSSFSTLSLLLFSGASVLLVGGAYGFLYFKILSYQRDLAELQTEEASSFIEERLNRSLGALVRETAEERSVIDRHFVSPEGVVAFIEEVENLGRKAGATIEVRGVEVAAEASGSDVIENLILTLSGGGSYEKAARLASLLENIPYVSRVAKFSLERREGAGKSPQWDVHLTLRVIKLADQK